MSKNQNIRRKKQNVPKAASAARPKPIKRRPAIKAALRKRPNGKLYAAILAGGIGSRFWPLSRETTPKQLLKVVGDESLLKCTIKRLQPLVSPERVMIVTNARQAEIIRLHLTCDGGSQVSPGYVIEPMGRNTAAAIALAAIDLYRKDPDAVMAVLPADHVIEDGKPFRAALKAALQAARDGHLVTFGIVPTHPETGYGYIKSVPDRVRLYQIRSQGLQENRWVQHQKRRKVCREAGYKAGQAVPQGRRLLLEFRHLSLEGIEDTRGDEAAPARYL